MPSSNSPIRTFLPIAPSALEIAILRQLEDEWRVAQDGRHMQFTPSTTVRLLPAERRAANVEINFTVVKNRDPVPDKAEVQFHLGDFTDEYVAPTPPATRYEREDVI